MAEHNLFMGGAGPNGGVAPGVYNAQGFPSVPPGLDDYFRFDARRTPAIGCITRQLIWERAEGPKRPNEARSPFLASYLDNNPIVAGDKLHIILLPRRSTLLRVWWSVERPFPGMDFDLQITSLTSPPVTSPITTAPINTATVNTGVIDVPGVLGSLGAAYQPQNAMLTMVINNLPAGGIRGSYVKVSAIIEQYEAGGN